MKLGVSRLRPTRSEFLSLCVGKQSALLVKYGLVSPATYAIVGSVKATLNSTKNEQVCCLGTLTDKFEVHMLLQRGK